MTTTHLLFRFWLWLIILLGNATASADLPSFDDLKGSCYFKCKALKSQKRLYLQHCLLVVQKRIWFPWSPCEGGAVDVLHRGPGHKPGVGDLHVLVALLYRPFCQDTKGHPHLFLRPPILELQSIKILNQFTWGTSVHVHKEDEYWRSSSSWTHLSTDQNISWTFEFKSMPNLLLKVCQAGLFLIEIDVLEGWAADGDQQVPEADEKRLWDLEDFRI